MTDSRLRAALEKLATEWRYAEDDLTPWQEGGGPNPYESALDAASHRLAGLLAAHPAVPAEPVDVPDEVTFAALHGYKKRPGYSELERMRDALEAVLPLLAVPRTVNRPPSHLPLDCRGEGHEIEAEVRDCRTCASARVVDRPLLDREAVERAISRGLAANWGIDMLVDEVMRLARPMPALEVLDEIVYDELLGEGVGVYPGTTAKVAARILALLGGVDESISPRCPENTEGHSWTGAQDGEGKPVGYMHCGYCGTPHPQSTPAQRALAGHFNPAGIACTETRVDESGQS